MVIRALVLALAWAGAVTATAAPDPGPIMTEQDIRFMFQAVEKENQQRAQRYSVENAANLVDPSGSQPAAAAAPSAQLTKYGAEPVPAEPTPAEQPAEAAPAPAGAPTLKKYQKGQSPRNGAPAGQAAKPKPKPAYVYIPPKRSAQGSNAGYSFGAEASGPHFGISRGAWIPVRLDRDTNSAEPGDVSLITTAEVQGRARSLPSGSELFGQRRYNSATDRLDIFVTGGQLPDGTEFKVVGQLFDKTKVSGLDGITKKVDVAQGAAASGGVAAAGALLDSLASSNPVTAGIGTAGGQILKQGETAASDLLTPSTVIYVSAQGGYVRLSASF
jgi:hypothetical protein